MKFVKINPNKIAWASFSFSLEFKSSSLNLVFCFNFTILIEKGAPHLSQ